MRGCPAGVNSPAPSVRLGDCRLNVVGGVIAGLVPHDDATSEHVGFTIHGRRRIDEQDAEPQEPLL